MVVLKYILIFLIAQVISNSYFTPPISNYNFNEKQLLQDTTKFYYINAKLIDTVKEYEIAKLCEYCALVVRFKIEPTYLGTEIIDFAIFNPDFKVMKLNQPGGTFSIKAFSKYKGPTILMVPAVVHKNKVPLLWCDNIAPNF